MTINNDAINKNPLVLAFAGDAYWTLYIRKMLVQKYQEKVNKLHLQANQYVCASAQRGFYKKLEPFLTEAELSIAGRARNTHQHSVAKNASLMDYKYATAFEAVIGYNFLAGNIKRLDGLFDIILEEKIELTEGQQ